MSMSSDSDAIQHLALVALALARLGAAAPGGRIDALGAAAAVSTSATRVAKQIGLAYQPARLLAALSLAIACLARARLQLLAERARDRPARRSARRQPVGAARVIACCSASR